MSKVFIGVDVGTSSVRVVAVDERGQVVVEAERALEIFHPKRDNDSVVFHEQSTDQIWAAFCEAFNELLTNGAVTAETVQAVGFDATCSLVVLDENGAALPVSPVEEDHRATAEADEINATKHSLLNIVGGCISPEMEPPKLLWLKRNNAKTFEKAAHFMDLADYMTFRATGSLVRSQCTVVCKWLFDADANQWDKSFWKSCGFSRFDEELAGKIGKQVQLPGRSVANGLNKKAASELGLLEGTPVATSILDAHAGTIASLATSTSENIPIKNRLSMICGTSVCHMVLSSRPDFVPGVWGPYKSVIYPGLYLNEAGQSFVGPMLTLLFKTYGRSSNDGEARVAETRLLDRLERDCREHPFKLAKLAEPLTIWPDYHGNRSPLANPNTSGAIVGLREVSSFEAIYVGHVFALAYMTRLIVDRLADDRRPSLVHMCGGVGLNNWLYVQAHADVLRRPVLLSNGRQLVAVGAASLAAHAVEQRLTLEQTAAKFAQPATLYRPSGDERLLEFHDKKYEMFKKLGRLVDEFASSGR